MKRILYCEFCEDGSVGGSHQALFDNVRLLDRDRYQPVVTFYEDHRFVEPLRELGATVHIWDEVRREERDAFTAGGIVRKSQALLQAIVRRRRLLEDESIDLVHLNNSPSLGLDDWLPAARWRRVPCIVNVMGAPYEVPRRRLHRFLVGHFDRLVAISDHVHRELIRGGYPESKIEAIRIGVDLERFTARVARAPEEVRRELGIAPSVMLVAMVGNLQPWKGHRTVVSALEQMDLGQRQQLCVLFIGAIREEDRAHVAALEKRIRKGDFQQSVRFLGARTDVPDLLNAADLQLHASTFPEPFGLVLVEGLALGKPVLAASRGGPCEVITPETGRLFDANEPDELQAALVALLGDPALRRRLGSAAPERAQLFTAALMAEKTQALYARLLAGRGERRE